jgi:hypothetical protein
MERFLSWFGWDLGVFAYTKTIVLCQLYRQPAIEETGEQGDDDEAAGGALKAVEGTDSGATAEWDVASGYW